MVMGELAMSVETELAVYFAAGAFTLMSIAALALVAVMACIDLVIYLVTRGRGTRYGEGRY